MQVLNNGNESSESEQRRDPFKRVHDFNTTGLKIMTLGIPPQEFMGKIGPKHVLLYLFIHIPTSVFGMYELVASLFLSESFIELLGHWYVVVYSWFAAFQFTYICNIFDEISDEALGNEHFHTSKMFPEIAERVVDRNINSFKKWFIVFELILIGTAIAYFGGAIIQIVVELVTTGTVEQVAILSYYPSVPLWGQTVVSIINIFTDMVYTTTITSVFILTGIRSLRIKIQCEIIGEVLTQTDVDFRYCIKDHVELLRISNRSMGICKILNDPLFGCIYLCLAVQLLTLTLIEPTGSYFFSMGTDFLLSLTLVVSQSWFSSFITHSLESLADSAYSTPWADRDQSYAKDVIIMSSMAQQPVEQMLWLNTLKVERATVLTILESSYSFYTILMIVGDRK